MQALRYLLHRRKKSETDKPTLLTKAEFIKSLENLERLNWTGFAQSWYNIHIERGDETHFQK